MFGFNKKDTTSDYYKMISLQKSLKDRYKEYFEWQESDDYKLFNHLQKLIIKTYKTVNIKADLLGTRLDESLTRSDYIEDFKVFFKPEVFEKLKEWCRKYELLREHEQKIMENL